MKLTEKPTHIHIGIAVSAVCDGHERPMDFMSFKVDINSDVYANLKTGFAICRSRADHHTKELLDDIAEQLENKQ